MAERSFVGPLSNTNVTIPDVSVAPIPELESDVYPDARNYRHRFGLLLPATNTSMEHELWSIIFANPGERGLQETVSRRG